MQERKYRGISYETNQFVYGWLHQTKYESSKYFIRTFPNEDDDYVDVVVDKNTIGQYTGIKDKNCVKIFEGDIVRFEDELYIVVYDIEECRFMLSDKEYYDVPRFLANWRAMYIEVIGNIYKNPELLEEEQNETMAL